MRCGEDDGDCERPDQVCLPEEDCASDTDCAKNLPNLRPTTAGGKSLRRGALRGRLHLRCEQHVSPITGETTEQAACLPQEEELLRYCFNDLTGNEHERCAFPGDEGFDENINCMPAEGSASPTFVGTARFEEEGPALEMRASFAFPIWKPQAK